MIDYEIIETTETTFDWDITEIISNWHNWEVSEGILELSKENESILYDNIWFNSEEYSVALGPKITIGFQSGTGLYNYWSYHSAPVGDAGTGMISDFTGELSHILPLYSSRNKGMSIDLSMIYSENMKTYFDGFGFGWKTNYNQRLLLDDNGYYLLEASGAETYFVSKICGDISDEQNLTNCYIAEDGSRMVLDVTSGDTYIYSTDRVQYTFNNTYLTKIKDLKTDFYVNIILVNNRIEFVMDHYGNKLDFVYESGSSIIDRFNAYIIDEASNLTQVQEIDLTITNLDLLSVDYSRDYDGDGIWNPDSTLDNTILISYLIDNKLDIVTSSHGTVLDYDYENGQVSKYTFTDGASNLGYVSMNYSIGKTTFTNHKNEKTEYLFDYYGHTVNVLDGFGNATFFSYINPFTTSISNPNYFLNHRVISSSLPQKTTLNPVYNHSFENPDSNVWVWDDGGSTNNTNVIDSSHSLLGDYSLVIFKDTTGTPKVSQEIILDQDSYILSGYVKNDTVTRSAFFDIINESSIIGTIPKISADGLWHYFEISFVVNTDNSMLTIDLLNNYSGNVYFDSIQIVDGFRDTRNNMLENPSFEIDSSDWAFSNGTYINRVYDNVESGDLKDSILGDYYIEIEGTASEARYIQTTLSNNEYEIDAYYVIGNWVKGIVTPSNTDNVVSNDRVYGLVVELYDGIILDDTLYFPYNSNVDDWQYVVSKFYVSSNIDSVKIASVFQGEGTVFLDGFQLYNEAFGNQTEFDSYGNVLNTMSPASEGVTEYKMVTGSKFLYDTITTPDGLTTNFDYTSNGRFQQIERSNVTSSVTYDATSNRISEVTVGDLGTDYYKNFMQFDTATSMYLLETEDEFGAVVTWLYDYDSSLVSTITNPKDVVTSFTYTKDGRLHTVATDSSQNTYTYVDDLLETVEVNGFEYNLVYDELDRLETIYIDEGTANEITLIDYEYDTDTVNSVEYETNRLFEQTYGSGDQIKLEYNQENRLSHVYFKSSGGTYTLRYEYKYNQSGSLTIIKDYHNLKEYYYTYDLVGRLKKITDNYGDYFSYDFDNGGNLDSYTYNVNGFSREVFYDHDLLTGQYDKTQFGNITKDYSYDNTTLKRLNSITLENGTLLINDISFTYFNTSEVLNGNISSRLKKYSQEFLGGIFIDETMEYDANGNITKINRNFNGVPKYTEYYYDNKDQLVRENNQLSNYTYIYIYDNYGNIDYQYYYNFEPGNSAPSTDLLYTESYIYDIVWRDRLKVFSFEDNNTPVNDYTVAYSYNNLDGNVTLMDDSRNTANDLVFDWEGRNLTEISYEGELLFEGDNILNPNGFISLGMSGPVSQSNIGPLNEHTDYTLVLPDSNTFSSLYLEMFGDGETIPFFNGYTQQLNECYEDVGVVMCTFNTGTYTSLSIVLNDDYVSVEEYIYFLGVDGNWIIQEGDWNYTGPETYIGWQSEDIDYEYFYNQSGIRTKKIINGITTDYVLDGSNVIFESTDTDEIFYTYDIDGSLISMRYNGTEYYYVYNILGDVVHLLDAYGDIVVEYRYDAYGNLDDTIILTGVGLANPYRYRSYRFDEETGYYYLNSRYYNSITGSFINADGMIDTGGITGKNMFAYTSNNPVMLTDASGYCSDVSDEDQDGNIGEESSSNCMGSGNGPAYSMSAVGGGFELTTVSGKLTTPSVGTAVGQLLGAIGIVGAMDLVIKRDFNIDMDQVNTWASTATSEKTQKKLEKNYVVYELYSDEGKTNVIYVGITNDFKTRMKQHRSHKYFKDMTIWGLTIVPNLTRSQALVIESAMIFAYSLGDIKNKLLVNRIFSVSSRKNKIGFMESQILVGFTVTN